MNKIHGKKNELLWSSRPQECILCILNLVPRKGSALYCLFIPYEKRTTFTVLTNFPTDSSRAHNPNFGALFSCNNRPTVRCTVKFIQDFLQKKKQRSIRVFRPIKTPASDHGVIKPHETWLCYSGRCSIALPLMQMRVKWSDYKRCFLSCDTSSQGI